MQAGAEAAIEHYFYVRERPAYNKYCVVGETGYWITDENGDPVEVQAFNVIAGFASDSDRIITVYDSQFFTC